MLVATGLALMGLTVFAAVPVAGAFLGEIVLGLGMGIVYPTLSVLVLELSRPGEEGENSASLGVGESVYTVVAVAVTGAILAALGAAVFTYVLCFALTALMAATGALVAGRVGESLRRFEKVARRAAVANTRSPTASRGPTRREPLGARTRRRRARRRIRTS